MRVLWLLVLVGCIDEIDPRWELDHDRVVAVRATPPRIMPDELTTLDALVAHAGRTTSVDQAIDVTAPAAPVELQRMIAFDAGAWTVRAPTDITGPRRAMGLPDDAPIPVHLLLVFANELYVKKTVWLGERSENPAPPAITIDGQPAGDDLSIPLRRDVYVEVAGERVNWLTSCGMLFQDDVARAFIRADEPCDGELAVVIRDARGGVSWSVTRFSAR
jgi:hypothetical protein